MLVRDDPAGLPLADRSGAVVGGVAASAPEPIGGQDDAVEEITAAHGEQVAHQVDGLVGERLHLRVDERQVVVEGLLVHRRHLAVDAVDAVLPVVVAGEQRRDHGADNVLRAAVGQLALLLPTPAAAAVVVRVLLLLERVLEQPGPLCRVDGVGQRARVALEVQLVGVAPCDARYLVRHEVLAAAVALGDVGHALHQRAHVALHRHVGQLFRRRPVLLPA
eukprot:7380400-Prymnesium_polylepis.1